jgi:hypothetical protein
VVKKKYFYFVNSFIPSVRQWRSYQIKKNIIYSTYKLLFGELLWYDLSPLVTLVFYSAIEKLSTKAQCSGGSGLESKESNKRPQQDICEGDYIHITNLITLTLEINCETDEFIFP